MVKITIEEVEALQKRRREINHTPIEEIEWTENGKAIPVTPEQLDDFKFTGLCNIDFVDFAWWRGPEHIKRFENGILVEETFRGDDASMV